MRRQSAQVETECTSRGKWHGAHSIQSTAHEAQTDTGAQHAAHAVTSASSWASAASAASGTSWMRCDSSKSWRSVSSSAYASAVCVGEVVMRQLGAWWAAWTVRVPCADLATVRAREAQHVAEVERGRNGVLLQVIEQRRDDLELEDALAAAVRARTEFCEP